jgi:hypothetical protein
MVTLKNRTSKEGDTLPVTMLGTWVVTLIFKRDT